MRVVITGASSGIGAQTAHYLAEKGHEVFCLSRSTGALNNVNYISTDVTDVNSLNNAFNIITSGGNIDVLINNAGIGIGGAIETHQLDDIDKIIGVNLKGVITTTKIALPYLRESKGKIINIGSIAGELPIPFQIMYSLTKASVHSFSLALANEVKPFGVKVCCVMPGDTKTSFTANRKIDLHNDVYQDRAIKSIRKMENDEQKGVSPILVSKTIYKCIKKKNPPLKIAVGFSYKFFLLLNRLLPTKLANYILYNIYAK